MEKLEKFQTLQDGYTMKDTTIATIPEISNQHPMDIPCKDHGSLFWEDRCELVIDPKSPSGCLTPRSSKPEISIQTSQLERGLACFKHQRYHTIPTCPILYCPPVN